MRGTRLPCVLLALAIAACDGRPHAHPHQQLARVVYHTQVSYEVSGNEVLSGVPMRLHLPIRGSATAISADGDLLTAQHVAQIDYTRALCYGMFIDMERHVGMRNARLESVQLAVDGPDGKQWRGSAIAAPGPVCDASLRVRLAWDAKSTATIVAVDNNADLALLHIEETDIAHLTIERTPPARGTPVVSAGFSILGLTFREGEVVEPCFVHSGLGTLIPRMPPLRMSQTLRSGMSGGPTAAGDRLLGISIMVQHVPPYHSFAVPAPYAAAWYDWVRGRTATPPEPKCP